jgi:riboflavin synthase
VFTGIVAAVGTCASVREAAGTRRIELATGTLSTGGLRIGDSVAVSGVCLTLVEVAAGRFAAELSGETLARTTLGALAPGSPVNLEPALAAGAPLGGHLVAGHVDGIATVREVHPDGAALAAAVEAPAPLARFIAEKGSVTLDGVSLTVGRVAGARFEVTLVPHTLSMTTLGGLAAGRSLNLEVDLVARYLDRLLEARGIR